MKTRTAVGLTLCALICCLIPAVANAATLAERVAALERAVATLQAQVTALQNTLTGASNVLALNPYLTVDTATKRVRFTGVNLQLVNGTGETNTRNGLGNLLVGYDLPLTSYNWFCSDGQYIDQSSCEGAGETWATSHKTGSHYLVVGDENNYSQYGGVVVGLRNTSNGQYASVSGGSGNSASGGYASVSGGAANTASGHEASVSGGQHNTASGSWASVSGGSGNTASGGSASVSGGASRTASGINDWRAGGLYQNY